MPARASRWRDGKSGSALIRIRRGKSRRGFRSAEPARRTRRRGRFICSAFLNRITYRARCWSLAAGRVRGEGKDLLFLKKKQQNDVAQSYRGSSPFSLLVRNDRRVDHAQVALDLPGDRR